MSVKSSADAFIEKYIERFGVMGSNNFNGTRMNSQSLCEHEWSCDNHYGFGFNGIPLSQRVKSSDFYYVQYQRVPEECGDLREEIIRAIRYFSRQNGGVSVPGHGGILCEVLINACREAGIAFQVVQLDFTDLAYAWPQYRDVKIERPRVNLRELQNFSDQFNELSACIDAEIIFHAFVGFRSELPHIYETHLGLQFTDYNFDYLEDITVGPANWCLVDAEKRTATCRFLHGMGRVGLVDFFHFTPELMRAYMMHPHFQLLLDPPKEEMRCRNNFANHIAMMKACFPDIPERNYFEILNHKLRAWLSEQSCKLAAQSDGSCRGTWVTPYDFFARKWALPNGSPRLKDQYGIVF